MTERLLQEATADELCRQLAMRLGHVVWYCAADDVVKVCHPRQPHHMEFGDPKTWED